MTAFDCLNSWIQCDQVRMVRKGDFSLQMDMMGRGYLYNLREDPYELDNLYDRPGMECAQADMLSTLAAAMLRACDPLSAPHYRYRTKIHSRGLWFPDDPAADCGVRDMPRLAEFARHGGKKPRRGGWN